MSFTIQKKITDDMIAFMYLVYEKESVIAKGNVVYDVYTGEVKTFTCDAEYKDEMETFIKNLIQYFGEINYVAKMNTMKRPRKSTSTGFGNSTDNTGTAPKISVEYVFATAMEQSAYVPKRNIYGKTKKTSTKRIRQKQSKAKQSNRHTHKKTVYKVEFWEKAGYYRKDGTYVKPCSCRRHILA